MIYRGLFTVTAVFAAAIGAVLIFAPRVYLSLYVTPITPDMTFAAQRLAPAIVGLAALLWLARDLPAGPFPAAFSLIAAGVWFGVAATGLYHFATDMAGVGILVAAATEVILGVLFVIASRQIRHG